MVKNKKLLAVCKIVGVVVVIGVICFVLNNFMNKQEYMKDLHSDVHPSGMNPMDQAESTVDEAVDNAAAVENFTNEEPSCAPKENLMPEELLPQDSGANAWSLQNPQGSGSLKDKNFLQAGHNIGINTVGQTLRNANMQLRSDPPNPQVAVSPWQQSTINPDTNRKPMEIGGCS